MENRICILTLFVFLFLLSGESRAMVAMPDAWTRMMIGVNQKDWSLLRERVQADLHVPDREDVLMLIDYHRDDRMKCENLLRRLNGGEAYRYIMNKILPLLYVYREHSPVPIPDDKAAGVFLSTANVLPRVKFVHPQPVVPEEGKIETPEIIEQRTVLALKNTLLYDLALAPNIEVEIPLNRRWSVNAEYKCPWWLNSSREFCYQLLSGGVEGRCWLGNRKRRNRLAGHFIGAYAEGVIYDFQFKGDGYQGRYYAASGLTYGYAKQIARHLSFEFSLGIGYLTTEYKKYTPYEGDLVWKSSARYNFIGPTKAKVSLVWLITTRR